VETGVACAILWARINSFVFIAVLKKKIQLQGLGISAFLPSELPIKLGSFGCLKQDDVHTMQPGGRKVLHRRFGKSQLRLL
jgi:hypothetical protein